MNIGILDPSDPGIPPAIAIKNEGEQARAVCPSCMAKIQLQSSDGTEYTLHFINEHTRPEDRTWTSDDQERWEETAS